jgi:serine/threonine-protein kinase
LRGEIDAILAKAMQREPERRYGTAEALALDIERHLQGETVSARPDSLGYRLHKGIQRHWVAVSTISAVLIAVVSGSAVAVMQAQKAARSAEREQVVREFVADVFRVNSRVNPINAALRPATPLSLLEGGAQLIQQRFKGQPDMQAELFGVVGGVFSDMGAYKLAAEYATRRIEALDLVGTDKAERSKALFALAQALFDDGKFADAELRARKAEELATTDAPVLLDAVVLRVRLELALGKFDAARSSLLLLERLASSTAAPTAAKAWALSFRARLLGEDSRLDEAISSFEKAIDTALHAEGPLSTTAITIRRTLAAVLIQNGNLIAGRRQYDAALAALHQLGGAHEVQAIYVSAQAAHDQNAGWALSVDEAVSEMRRCRRLLELSPMPVPKWYLAQLDFWIGEIQGLSGNVSSALPLLESSGDVLRKEFTSMSSLRRIAKLTGLVMGKAGRHDAANRLLRQALDLRLASGRKNHPTLAFDYALLSQNFTMAGDYAEAERTLAEAPRFEPLQGSPTGGSEFNQIVEWARASIQIAQGNAKAALKLLRDNEPTTQEAALLSVYRATLGEALCADHQPVQGLAAMRQAIHELEAGGEHPDSPDLARSRSIAGLCALAAGNLNLASAYAAKARSAFTAQPGVSPYYKKPSEALDRKMGVRTGALKTS